MINNGTYKTQSLIDFRLCRQGLDQNCKVGFLSDFFIQLMIDT